MKRLSFLFQYIVHPRTVGAVLPSSRFLGDKMPYFVVFGPKKYALWRIKKSFTANYAKNVNKAA
ncbi:hypothetical protein CHH92_15595 [Bacillus sonorensis]|uniref:Uncharacterized protein n=1 Tax=Bacillus sonorensis TaxID=119858 RepID=A0ABN5ANS6_9BACI|nr:hypothetical protein S101395_04796 [Bacillus sonorensis]PAD59169.1 hypothetical protein CHH92_15595 [Bacillus sonorensis]GIN69009.1 hypothetical protein J41TS2_44300 [Bacillus sonorensis]